MTTRLQFYDMEDTYGGINPTLAPHVLPNNVATLMTNWVLRKEGAETAKGWEKFTNQVLTNGAASATTSTVIHLDQYFKNDGAGYLLAFTNHKVYFFRETNDLWVPITPGAKASTTVNTDSASGANILFVASTSGYAAGDTIVINEGGARQEQAVVDAILAGPARLQLLANLTFTHTLAQADAVRRTYAAAVVDADSAAGATVLSVSHTTQFTTGEQIIIGIGTVREEYLDITGITAGVSLTVSRPSWAPSGTGLQFTHTAAQADKIYRLAGLDQYSQTSEIISSDLSNNTIYFTNFNDRVQKFTATSDVTGAWFHEDLPGLNNCEGMTPGQVCKAKYIKIFEGFVVLGHLNENGTTIPQKIRWSRYANFESWVNNTDGSGQAGYFTFEGPDWIQGLFQLKREVSIQRERSIEAMTYVGPPDIFSFRRAETGLGLLAFKFLIDMGDEHIFVAPDNVWAWNGISVQAIGDKIKKFLFDSITPSQREFCIAFFVEEEDEVWFCYPDSSSKSCLKAWVYNIIFKEWSGPREVQGTAFGYYDRQSDTTWDSITGTWDGLSGVWDSRLFLSNSPINLMGDENGLIYIVDSSSTKDGTTMTKTYATKVTDLGDPNHMKRLQRVRVGMRQDGAYTISAYVGTATNEGDQVTWFGPFSLSVDANALPYFYCDLTARLFQFKFETTSVANIRKVGADFMLRDSHK